MSEDIRFSLKPGMIVKVHQKIKEKNTKGQVKERIQIFEGSILAVKHGKESGATVTVRKISNGVGVEKIFPLHSPVVEKIELVREMKVKRAKAYYLRSFKKKLKEVKKKKPVVKKTEKKVEKKEVKIETKTEAKKPVVEVEKKVEEKKTEEKK